VIKVYAYKMVLSAAAGGGSRGLIGG